MITIKAIGSRQEKLRKAGKHKAREHSSDLRMIRAVWSEGVAARYFERLGFDVEVTSCFGPDLVCSSPGKSFFCEVKAVSKQNVGNSWYVHGVYPTRSNDDFIVMVFPNGFVHIEKMADHLSACAPNGRRTVTALARGCCPYLFKESE